MPYRCKIPKRKMKSQGVAYSKGKRVVSAVRTTSGYGSRWTLELECGHTAIRYGYRPAPMMVLCPTCTPLGRDNQPQEARDGA